MSSNTNFCTWNPFDCASNLVFNTGNLSTNQDNNDWRGMFGTHSFSSGKWYWEAYQSANNANNAFPVAIQRASDGKNPLMWSGSNAYLGRAVSTYGYSYAIYTNAPTYSEKRHNGSATNTNLSAGTSTDIYQLAIDLDNGKIWFGKNNTWADSGNPSSGSNEAYSSIPAGTYVPASVTWNSSGSDNFISNWGQDSSFAGNKTSGSANATDGNGYGDFYYTPPTGFLALCSANLPLSNDIDPAQTNDDYVGGKHFNAITWSGNSTDDTTISGVGFQSDLIFSKATNTTEDWNVVDTNRGVASSRLKANSTAAQSTSTDATTGCKSVNSDGFVLGTATNWNSSSNSYAAYCWRANGGTTSSNSEGDITSTVQANQDAGFSIVTYTGDLTSSGNRTVGHGLSQAPEFIMRKSINTTERWAVSHGSCSSFNEMLELNTTAAEVDKSSNGSMSAPTTTVFSNNYTDGYAVNGTNYVAYCWHSVEGYSKFGKYHGSSSASGSFVYTGFRPKLLFVKKIDEASTTYGWAQWNTASQNYNATTMNGGWFDTAAAWGNNYYIDMYSNGFKFWDNNTNLEENGHTYIYGAWGDTPGKYSNAR